MKKARYCQDEIASLKLSVAKENPDGSVDLAKADGTVVITSCPVSKENQVGHAVLLPDEAEPEKKDSKPDPKSKK